MGHYITLKTVSQKVWQGWGEPTCLLHELFFQGAEQDEIELHLDAYFHYVLGR